MDIPHVPGYRLERRIGTGASGDVWQARRSADGLAVAVKVVSLPGAAEDADRAAREFTVLQRVAAEGLVGFHEAVSVTGHSPTLALVLDLVPGGSLLSALAARGHLSAGEAATVLTGVGRALAGLHAAGVAHADVSPSNVLLELSGRPVLADLGVARLVGEEPGESSGTPGFTAPEVEMGQATGPACDIYSLGALAWYCVTGAPPPPLALRPPLQEVAPGLPPAFVTALQQCLAPDPGERPSAAEAALQFFDAVPCEPLRLAVGGDEVAMLTRRIRAAAPTGTSVPPGTASGPPRWWTRIPGGWPPRGCPRLPAAAAAVLLLGGGVALLGPRAGLAGAAGTGPERPAPAPPSTERVTAAVRDPASPRLRAPALLQELADERAAALASNDAAALGALAVPGSPALEADRTLLRTLRRSGLRYAGLRFAVRSASALRAGGTSAAVVATVDTLAHEVQGADGVTAGRPAVPGEPLAFDLRWSGERWQVQAVSAPRAAR
jgi:hypothetical protein